MSLKVTYEILATYFHIQNYQEFQDIVVNGRFPSRYLRNNSVGLTAHLDPLHIKDFILTHVPQFQGTENLAQQHIANLNLLPQLFVLYFEIEQLPKPFFWPALRDDFMQIFTAEANVEVLLNAFQEKMAFVLDLSKLIEATHKIVMGARSVTDPKWQFLILKLYGLLEAACTSLTHLKELQPLILETRRLANLINESHLFRDSLRLRRFIGELLQVKFATVAIATKLKVLVDYLFAVEQKIKGAAFTTEDNVAFSTVNADSLIKFTTDIFELALVKMDDHLDFTPLLTHLKCIWRDIEDLGRDVGGQMMKALNGFHRYFKDFDNRHHYGRAAEARNRAEFYYAGLQCPQLDTGFKLALLIALLTSQKGNTLQEYVVSEFLEPLVRHNVKKYFDSSLPVIVKRLKIILIGLTTKFKFLPADIAAINSTTIFALANISNVTTNDAELFKQYIIEPIVRSANGEDNIDLVHAALNKVGDVAIVKKRREAAFQTLQARLTHSLPGISLAPISALTAAVDASRRQIENIFKLQSPLQLVDLLRKRRAHSHYAEGAVVSLATARHDFDPRFGVAQNLQDIYYFYDLSEYDYNGNGTERALSPTEWEQARFLTCVGGGAQVIDAHGHQGKAYSTPLSLRLPPQHNVIVACNRPVVSTQGYYHLPDEYYEQPIPAHVVVCSDFEFEKYSLEKLIDGDCALIAANLKNADGTDLQENADGICAHEGRQYKMLRRQDTSALSNENGEVVTAQLYLDIDAYKRDVKEHLLRKFKAALASHHQSYNRTSNIEFILSLPGLGCFANLFHNPNNSIASILAPLAAEAYREAIHEINAYQQSTREDWGRRGFGTIAKIRLVRPTHPGSEYQRDAIDNVFFKRNYADFNEPKRQRITQLISKGLHLLDEAECQELESGITELYRFSTVALMEPVKIKQLMQFIVRVPTGTLVEKYRQISQGNESLFEGLLDGGMHPDATKGLLLEGTNIYVAANNDLVECFKRATPNLALTIVVAGDARAYGGNEKARASQEPGVYACIPGLRLLTCALQNFFMLTRAVAFAAIETDCMGQTNARLKIDEASAQQLLQHCEELSYYVLQEPVIASADIITQTIAALNAWKMQSSSVRTLFPSLRKTLPLTQTVDRYLWLLNAPHIAIDFKLSVVMALLSSRSGLAQSVNAYLNEDKALQLSPSANCIEVGVVLARFRTLDHLPATFRCFDSGVDINDNAVIRLIKDVATGRNQGNFDAMVGAEQGGHGAFVVSVAGMLGLAGAMVGRFEHQ